MQGGGDLVKGISRRVILVDGPAGGTFEQAIFILPRDSPGVSRQQLVDEAVRVAKSYARSHGMRRRVRIPPALWAFIGGGAMGLIWLLAALL